MTLKDAIEAALESLGDTPDDVARTLGLLGHTGRTQETGLCPVADFVRAAADRHGYDEVDIDVFDTTTFVWAERKHAENDDEPETADQHARRALRAGSRINFAVENPPAVEDFIQAFDDGCYPELDEHATREAT